MELCFSFFSFFFSFVVLVWFFFCVFFFSEILSIDTSCESFTFHMKCQISSKIIATILIKRMSSATVLPSTLRVKMASVRLCSQWAHNVKVTSYQRRCDVITSHRR